MKNILAILVALLQLLLSDPAEPDVSHKSEEPNTI